MKTHQNKLDFGTFDVNELISLNVKLMLEFKVILLRNYETGESKNPV